ncbi:MAG TPA: FAD-linked oxidase C-terminal domain-containing protein [Candidatus Binataceae bacterium]|nr:FAD-linked oxidase C-terminal domain-containing protein [Candidatus Binataceae bacterium]
MASLSAIRDQLARTIDGDVLFDGASRALYATDASNYRRVPLGVVNPRHEGDVTRTLELARENHLPILPRGAGTALAGQATNTAIVLDFSRYMNRVLEIDPQRGIAAVEPGLVQSHLDVALAPHGLFFAPDPATKDRCTLGGMIGNNSCGAHSAAYGKTVDNVVGLDVMLYDGTRMAFGAGGEGEYAAALAAGGHCAEVYRKARSLIDTHGPLVRERYPSIPRRVSGYNLDELLPEHGFNLARAMVGSEGTLAVVLKATVRVVPKPQRLALVMLGFDDVFIAADQMPWLLSHRPEALEGFDDRLPEFARAKGLQAVRMLPDGRAFLIIEVGGADEDEVRERAHRIVREAARNSACIGRALLLDRAEQLAVWGLRESGLGASALIPGNPRTWPGAEDCAVPPARLGEYLRRFKQTLDHHHLVAATYYGHFGEGCVHCRINFDLFTKPGIATFRTAMTDIADLVADFGGSLSGEHGDGLARSELLPRIFGDRLLSAFRDFKSSFDPDHQMNPGVIVDPEPLDAHLKAGSNYTPRAINTHFDFSTEGGLAGATLKCVGIGKCRKTGAGTMCPSYMATGNELYSTRGRAHLIHESLTSDLLSGGFSDDALYESLDLCLSCKACKTECPASVDIAAYRAEFLAKYFQSHRRSLSLRFFGYIHEAARLAAFAPRLANALSSGPSGILIRRMLGFHPDRALPRFAYKTFRQWFRKHPPRNPSGDEVLLFPDTFSNFFEPEVAIAATEVLERAGFRVLIPESDLCCGRPLYEQGMLDVARLRMLQTTAALSPFVNRGAKVIGLEPSCILTFRDELPALFPHLADVRALAGNTLMLDEFLTRHAPAWMSPQIHGRALVHGHCHRKALAGMTNELALLGRAADLAIEAPDAGCCGMAGAFGYGNDRFEISRAIGERVLLPAIDASPPATTIIADGFACRSQIRQFCQGRQPLHLAQALNLGSTPIA